MDNTESDLGCRITKVEVKVNEIQKLSARFDSKLDEVIVAVSEVKLSLANQKSEFIQRPECLIVCQSMDKKFENVEKKFEQVDKKFTQQESERKKLRLALITAAITFGLWLFEQLIDVQIKLGG